MVASLGSAGSALPVIVGFGVMAGTGIGLGYAAATPAAVKWFRPDQKGFITGIMVAGFGVAPVYIAPLAKHLLVTHGISRAFLIVGAVFLLVAGVSAQSLRNPTGAAPAKPATGTITPTASDLAADVAYARLLVAVPAVRLRGHGRTDDHRSHRQDRHHAVEQRHPGGLSLRRVAGHLQRQRARDRGSGVGHHRAGRIADAMGGYARAYQVAGGLLLFAALLALLSHVHLAFRLSERQVVITFGSRARKTQLPDGDKRAA